MEILFLKSFNLILDISFPSINICPSVISNNLYRSRKIVLLPLPVWPTIPTDLPCGT